MSDDTPNDVYQKILSALMPYATLKTQIAKTQMPRFVHYTSAETAIKIIRNKNVWMRRASMMNDFSEVQYGLSQIAECYNKGNEGKRFKDFLEGCHSGIVSEFENYFSSWENEIVLRSYITSLSEHLPEEDGVGRLSMWRAYGSNRGVAFVVNPEAVIAEASSISAYTIPVHYIRERDYSAFFHEICDNVESLKDEITAFSKEQIIQVISHAFAFTALSTKHIGFQEEKEWRLVSIPSYLGSDELESSIEIVNGLPQPVYKIPIGGVNGFEGTRLGLNGVIQSIIIGPIDHSYTVREALITELELAGVENAGDKVLVSNIPLRS